jgi:hypothetical protein
MLSTLQFATIRDWMYRNARPLDYARWKFHFEDGYAEDILQCLSAYQNLDGGFGHALEPDAWNPHSSPLQTSVAVQLIEACGEIAADHPLIAGILRYLSSGVDFKEDRWCNVVPTNDDYPHAPWWDSSSDSRDRYEYNPTAILVGFALKYADEKADLYYLAWRLAKELTSLFMKHPLSEMHPLLCLRFLFHILEESGHKDESWFVNAPAKLINDMRLTIMQDLDNWNGYACMPTTFVTSKAHPLYAELEKETWLDLVSKSTSINHEGIWDISWAWTDYQEAFVLSRNWWKADLAIRNLLLFKNFGLIEER